MIFLIVDYCLFKLDNIIIKYILLQFDKKIYNFKVYYYILIYRFKVIIIKIIIDIFEEINKLILKFYENVNCLKSLKIFLK